MKTIILLLLSMPAISQVNLNLDTINQYSYRVDSSGLRKIKTTVVNDTIPVMLLVSDTTLHITYALPALEVIKVTVKEERERYDPNYVTEYGGMTLMATTYRWVNKTYKEPLGYLTMDKKPLPEKFIVWMKLNK